MPTGRGGGRRLPDLYIDWPYLSLDRFQEGGLVLLEGRYDAAADRIREPQYRMLSVPEALKLAPQLASTIAYYDARWARSFMPSRPEEIIALGLLPGPGTLDSLLKQLAPEAADRMPPEIVGKDSPAVRPELLLGLVVIHKRRPELVAERLPRVRAKVEAALARMTDADRARHAAELAYLLWRVFGEQARALEVFAQGVEHAPIERSNVNHYGIDALGLPPALMFAYLARTGGRSEKDRAALKRYLLDPVAADLMLATRIPLPACFFDGGALPILEPGWIALGQRSPQEGVLQALVGQFAGWPRIGQILVAAQAAAGVDRMPTAGPRGPDPKGVQATLHVLNPAATAQPLRVDSARVSWSGQPATPVAIRAAVPAQIAPRCAVAIRLGALDDHVLVPGEPFAVTLSVVSGGSTHTFNLQGKVGVSW